MPPRRPYCLALVLCGLSGGRALTGAGCLSNEPRLGCSLLSCCGTPAVGAHACALLQNGAAELSERGRHSRAAWDGSMRLRASYASVVSRSRELRPASVLQPLAIFGRCFPGSSLRDVGIILNVQKTRKYRWLAVLLVPTRKTSSTQPVSLGGQKASYSIQPRGRRVLVNKR